MKKRAYVCISDLDPRALEQLSMEYELVVRPIGDRPTETELIDLVSQYELLIIGVKETMTEAVYANASCLRTIGTLSIGLDHICNKFFDDPAIHICNTPMANTTSVAEHTMMLMLALSKRLIEANQSSFSHQDRKGMNAKPRDILDKTLGVVGAGKIGTKVAILAKAFGMRVYCHTLNPDKHLDLDRHGVQFLSLEEMLRISDIVSLHVPLDSTTKHLMSEISFGIIKKGAMLLNTSRADIVDYNALKKALISGQVGSAGLDDVNDADIDLFSEIPNIIITPHVAGVTVEAIARMDTELSNAIIHHTSVE